MQGKLLLHQGICTKFFHVCIGAVEMFEAELTNDIEMQQIIEFSTQFFFFWVIEFKFIPRADGEEFLKKKRGFCS